METPLEFEDPAEELRASNELLKLKLELEHGMKTYESNGISPQLEHQWLNYIYQHEQMYRSCGRIRLYDFVGRPAFTPIQQLRPEHVHDELQRLMAILKTYGIQLDFIRPYSHDVIYQFVTTEFFELQIDNIRMPGLVNHFTYEEFHMNHEYEMERIGLDLIRSIYHHEWRAEYDSLWIGATVKCNGIQHDVPGFSSVVTRFQSQYQHLELEECHIQEVTVYPDELAGRLRATISYRSQAHGSETTQLLSGECEIGYERRSASDYWQVTFIKVPGMLAVS